VDVDVTGVAQLRCAACGAPLQDGDRFCEHCGARQIDDADTVARGCRACGAAADAIDTDGYCSVCGARQRAAVDRTEVDLAVAAAVSDRGRAHHRNEDAYRIEVVAERGGTAVLCDGISSASAGDTAAASAAAAAAEVLARAAADSSRDGSDATREAIGAAFDAVSTVQWTTRTDRAMPSCTLVCALWRPPEIVIGSLGDSRAYWHDSEGTRQLTVDDSWAEEQVAQERLTPEQAMRDPRSHSITHWVGDDAPARPPRIHCLHPERPGRLLLCTDGLWNYVATPAALGQLIDALPAAASPAAVARALADVALDRGGRDNITVAVIDIA
jgi:PPM family protein phosphatase